MTKASPADVLRLQQVGRQTFSETFAATNTEEDLRAYLDSSFAEAKLTAELTHPGSEFWFAVVDGRVAGYLKINRAAAQTELQDAASLEIERIYVLQAYQGQKVGQRLFEEALRLAREQGAGYVWLGVWEHNEKALRFYEKNGFVPFGKHLFRLGNDEQTDIMMKLKIQ